MIEKIDINWGSSTQAQIYRRSLDYSLKLMNIEEHVKNFRPNFLVLTGLPMNRPALCDFVAALTKNTSLMVCANILVKKKIFKINATIDFLISKFQTIRKMGKLSQLIVFQHITTGYEKGILNLFIVKSTQTHSKMVQFR